MAIDVSKRIQALQGELEKLGLDAAMIYDRENLIYFAGVDDLEGGCLIVPAKGEPKLLVLALDARHMKASSGIDDVEGYNFPTVNVSMAAARALKKMGYVAPKLGFTRYFITLKDYQMLRETFPDFVVGDIATVCYRLRAVKDEGEIEKMLVAAKCVAVGQKAAEAVARPGMKEVEVLAEADYAMKKAGSEGASFRMQVLTHERQMLMHPFAGDNVIKDNEPLVVHLGASYKGYTAKMCRTYFLGDVPQETREVYEVLEGAQVAAIEALRPGATCDDIYEVTRAYVEEKGWGKWFVVEHVGYGVGIRQSEFYPILGKGIPTVLEAGMVVDVLLPTLYKPGVGGPRITDVVQIGENGCRNLTAEAYEAL